MRKIVNPEAAPAIGPYSPALKFGDFIQISGQIPIDADGAIVAGGVSEQTEQVMKNLQALVEAAGASMTQVVKCTCYLGDMADFPTFNDVYGNYFSEPYPCRATIQAVLPAGSRVEVDALLYLGKA